MTPRPRTNRGLWSTRREVAATADSFALIWNRSLLSAVDASGRLILDTVFGGDEELVSRRGPKDASLVQLSSELEQRGISLAPGRLRRMVKQHLILRDLREGTPDVELAWLTPSHLDEVAALPAPRRRVLLLDAEAHCDSVAALRERVRSIRPPRRRARRTLPAVATEPNGSVVSLRLTEVEACEEALRAAVAQVPLDASGEREPRIRALGVAIRLRELSERIERRLSGDASD